MANRYEQEKMTAASPESVAFQLMTILIDLEEKEMAPGFPNSADRKWLLDAFAECMEAVQGGRAVTRS